MQIRLHVVTMCNQKKSHMWTMQKVTYLMQAGLSNTARNFFLPYVLTAVYVFAFPLCCAFRSDIVALSEKLGQFILAHTLLLHEHAGPSTSRVRYLSFQTALAICFSALIRVLLIVVAGLF